MYSPFLKWICGWPQFPSMILCQNTGWKPPSRWNSASFSWMPRNNTAEQEANEFAGRLLVAETRLGELFDNFAREANRLMPNFMSGPLRDKFSERAHLASESMHKSLPSVWIGMVFGLRHDCEHPHRSKSQLSHRFVKHDGYSSGEIQAAHVICFRRNCDGLPPAPIDNVLSKTSAFSSKNQIKFVVVHAHGFCR